MNKQDLKKLLKMRQLNEQIQSKNKELKDFEKQINDLCKRVPKNGNHNLFEENEYLKAINKINKEDIINYKNQIKTLESKKKCNEEIISKLKIENEHLKRGRNNQAQNNGINNNCIKDFEIKEDNKYYELLNQLNEEKNKNKYLIEQLRNEQKKVKELNNKIKLYENNSNIKKIKELEETINSLNSKINNLNYNIDKDKITSIKSGEEIIALFFTSINQVVHRPISCKNTDTFVRIEEKIYNEYPQYKDYNTYLTVNGKVIKRFKTLEENNIKDGNIIIINIYDE